MPVNSIETAEFLNKSIDVPVFDVRSPAEYERGHIPGAISLPMFSNEERSVIGTLYLKKGSSEAMMKGLEIIGPKMKDVAATAKKIAPNGEALMYCWRGGMRSNSMAWLLNTVGIETCTLNGGYKAYRRYAHAFFEKPFNLIVISGMTGSGKTALLEAFEAKGEQVVNLEKLAGHKGSVFGGIGLPDQPTTEQFENNLFDHLMRLHPDKPVYVEDESISIGRVFIPRPFFQQMASARSYMLKTPLKRRIKNLVDEYTGGDKHLLIAGVRRIEKRLGLNNAAKAIDLIQQDDMAPAIKIVLDYYDKVYTHSIGLLNRKQIKEIITNDESVDEIATFIMDDNPSPGFDRLSHRPSTG